MTDEERSPPDKILGILDLIDRLRSRYPWDQLPGEPLDGPDYRWHIVCGANGVSAESN